MNINNYYKRINVTDGEKIIDVIFQHWLSKLHKIIIGIVLVIIPFFFMFSLISQGPFGVTGLISLLILAAVFIFREYYIWARNVFILTNKKIVDIDQKGFFVKTVSEVAYPKVLDVSYQSKGVISSIFNIGNILIKTSIPDLSILISNVGKVKIATASIIDLVEERGGMSDDIELTSEQKMQNFEDFLEQEGLDEYEEYKLKDLLAEYIEVYSKDRLKKLLVIELSKEDSIQDDNSVKHKPFSNKKLR